MGGKKTDELFDSYYYPIPSKPNPNSPNYPYLPSQNRHRNHRTRFQCPIYSIIALLIAAAAAAAAIFHLYPTDPEIQIIWIRLNRIAILTYPKPILDISLSLNVKVHNRYFLSLWYDSLSISVRYRNREVAFVTNGGGSYFVDWTYSVDGFGVKYDDFYLIEDLAKGVIQFDTDTLVEANLWLFLFSIPLKATVSCQVHVNIQNQTIVRQDCYPESLGDTLDQRAVVEAGDTWSKLLTKY